MSTFRFNEMDGKRHLWREILKMRRGQIPAHAKAFQPALFALKHDCRPATARTAADRYLEPSLFDGWRRP